MRDRFDRRHFLRTVGIEAAAFALSSQRRGITQTSLSGKGCQPPEDWLNPPREFSQAPFWFWNDDLSEAELVRQLDDFQAHGVHAFVIHPRAGLPRSIRWLSSEMIEFMRFAIDQAAERDMWVILYDEGMYPSGSSSGQVVAKKPAFRTRGLVCVDLDEAKPGSDVRGVRIGNDGGPELAPGQNLVAVVRLKQNGHRLAVIDRAARPGYSYIRGLHFVEEDPPRRADRKEVAENHPPAADILNPDAVACFIRLVYQRYYEEFDQHFGKTVKAIFTDEPSLLAKRGECGMVPGTTGILKHVNAYLGYDFTEHLPVLWYEDEPGAALYRRDYNRALQARLEQTFYHQISEWCNSHGIALAGHPMGPDDIGHLRHFHMPGQDIVWRYIEPSKSSALEGEQSTQGKCASSAMIHLRRRRNMNEFCGAYGHNFTFDEMKWLANWLLIRGCNLLVPHAFYYSVRGPRVDERPPDVGPNSAWWPQYKPFAGATARLCWLNTDSEHVCKLAILGLNDYLPWRAAKACFQHQRDFNYLEARHLWEDAKVGPGGIEIADMHYNALIIEGDPPKPAESAIDVLTRAERLIRWDAGMVDEDLVRRIDQLIVPDVQASPSAPDLRVRHVRKGGLDYYLLFNESTGTLKFQLRLSAHGRRMLMDPMAVYHEVWPISSPIVLASHEFKVLAVAPV